MNSRGALITQRNSGDTLPTSDSVAMTPTVQPAAAGTQRYRELDWLPERRVATVTDREDMPSTRENPGEGRGQLSGVPLPPLATSSCQGYAVRSQASCMPVPREVRAA